MTTRQFIERDHVCKCGSAAKRYVPTSDAVAATIMAAQEQTRGYRNQEHIESVKLPQYMKNKHVAGYGPNGEPRFLSRRAYIEAGRSCGMEWQ